MPDVFVVDDDVTVREVVRRQDLGHRHGTEEG